ncbi:hypothetical protein [Bradyrhizobium sp.]|uniref:hypothetical protein n=1 Tax=Bradyrhizobium sp. TaxID=376 RepID=UPI003C1D1B86
MTIGGITIHQDGIGKALRERVNAHIRQILAEHGPSAFEMPKRAAAVHEAGHIVIDSVLGIETTNVFIEARAIKGKLAWGGYSEAPDLEFFDTPDCPASFETLLNRSRSLFAGLTAEDLFAGEDRREGSSVDEIFASQLVCEIACSRRPDSDAESIWQNDVVAWCARQLQHNGTVHGEIADALMDNRRIRGKRLRDLCVKVEAA